MSPENREKQKAYSEHPGRVVEIDERFKYAMALALDPRSGYRDGIIRCIVDRTSDPSLHGNVDRSELRRVSGSSLEHFDIGERLRLRNEDEVIRSFGEKGDFIGLEDPDIWIDEKTGLMHVYFTIPFVGNDEWAISLGHAVGNDLDSLEMTEPALRGHSRSELCAKEVSIAPLNKNGFRYNLIEGYKESKDRPGHGCSTARVAIAEDMGKPWQYGETAFNPEEHNIPWISKHASPGPLFSKNFIDIGAGKALGFMNGRSLEVHEDKAIRHGTFSVGLFIYDYENGKIEWVSPEPLIRDSEARTITFASQFVEQGKGSGILYAHVDDSFVRAYTLNAEGIKSLLPG